MSASTAAQIALPLDATGLTMNQKVFAFATMTVGFFIALLDIQIVSASLKDVQAGLAAGPVRPAQYERIVPGCGPCGAWLLATASRRLKPSPGPGGGIR